MFRLFQKNSQCKQFYDNGGGYIPQYNDTVRELSQYQHVKIRVIDIHYILSVSIATVGTLDCSQAGPYIIIMHHFSYHRKVKTIHSSVNIECYNNDVNYKWIKVRGGEKQILTH